VSPLRSATPLQIVAAIIASLRPGLSFPVEQPFDLPVEFTMNMATFRSRARRWWRQEIRPLLILALVIFSIRSSLADWNDVPSGSMQPTILVGDRTFVNKLAYDLKVPFTTWHLAQWSNPQRGDIVVFYSPRDGTRLVKRVVGLPGDTVELRNEKLIINGNPVDYAPLSAEISDQLPEAERQRSLFATEQLSAHPHAVMAIPGLPAQRTFGPVQVPEGYYFMMGDNRDNSFDSRYFGMVERKRIVGKATAVVLSLDRNHYWLPRGQRLFTALDAKASH
jgi:signal peptidase I